MPPAHNSKVCHFVPQADIRAVREDSKMILEFMAVPYGKRSRKLYGSFYEYIQPRAFSESLAGNPDIYFFRNHDVNAVLARMPSTLSLSESDKGVTGRATLPDTELGRDTYTAVDRGDMSGMSFGFRTLEDTWRIEDGCDCRDVIKAELLEVSIVTYPAYTATEVHARSVDAMVTEFRKQRDERYRKEMDMILYRQKLIEME